MPAGLALPESDELAKHGITIEKRLGTGAFSEVFRGTAVLNGVTRKVAVKVYTKKFTELSQQQIFELARREVKTAGPLGHVNIMRTFTFVASGSLIASCLELAAGGDLSSRVFKDKGMDTVQGAKALAGIARGLRYLHEEHMMVHSDIKTENVLFAADGTTKIGDFDAMVPIGTALDTPRGTEDFLAPELVQPAGDFVFMQPTADVWGLGIVAYLLVFGTYPWDRADLSDARFARFAEFRTAFDAGGDAPKANAWGNVVDELNILFGRLFALGDASRATAAEAAIFFESEWVDAVKAQRSHRKRSSKGKVPAKRADRARSRSRGESTSTAPKYPHSFGSRLSSLFRTKSPRLGSDSPVPLLHAEPGSPARPGFLSPPRSQRPSVTSPLARECESAPIPIEFDSPRRPSYNGASSTTLLFTP
mmetsp:Transcript_17682/g.46150  ORF Transcript_17682/g.46150 Transcript_17682/m.46150 type:complete len:421 (+) Transcript_17682:117-1379(+)